MSSHTLPSGFPFWEFEALWSPEFLKNNLRVKTHLIKKLFIPLESS
jgi:hypothetical protein